MRWDEVLRSVMSVAESSVVLQGIYGEEWIRLSGVREYRVPSLELTLLGDDETELWEPTDIQFDQFTTSMADLVTSERALRTLFDHERPQTIGGTRMWSFYLEGDVLAGPNRDSAEDVFARAVRFRFAPIRERLIQGRS